MEKNKSLVLALLEILKTYSDEEHILTRDDFNKYLFELYGIEVERRTLYNNIDLLIDFGYDISKYDDNKKGYYLIDRQFEKSEVNLLCNSIHSSHIIPEKQSQELIDKLLKTQSKYEANNFREKVYSKNLRKTINKQFFLNIEMINEAIQIKKKISFTYTKYNLEKKRVPKKAIDYIVSPYSVVYMNENYYLICKFQDYDDLSHYRIDKMQDITILDEEVKPIDDNFEPYDYAKSKIYMYGGESVSVYLKCDSSILDDVIDKFGSDTTVIPINAESFKAKINASKQGVIYWVLQYIEHCEVLEPDELRKEIARILKNGIKKYQ